MKYCNACKQTKSKSEFNRNVSRSDGLQSQCRLCKKRRFRSYYRKNARVRHEIKERNVTRREDSKRLFLAFLKDKSCMDCGTDDTRVLECDHVGVKHYNISLMVTTGYKWETILKELTQCEIVCANCHRIRTYKRSDSYRRKRHE